jgi:RNA polymerase sigma-70 factor (ECF subfamily)
MSSSCLANSAAPDPAVCTDEQLARFYQRTGDDRAFEELTRRYEREVLSYLVARLGDFEAAKDVLQATLLLLHRKCDCFDSTREFRPWLYAVASRQAVDYRRRERRHHLVSLDTPVRDESGRDNSLNCLCEDERPGPLARLMAVEKRRRVQRNVGRLPEKSRSVVNLMFYRGFTQRETADLLKIPIGTVKSRLDRAYRTLRQELTECENCG